MNMPTLSVLMPNYNHGKYIGEALESIVNQSFKPYEVLIIDDASKDNSVNIIQQYTKSYSFVKCFVNKENQGIIRNENRLLQIAKDDYAYFASADDRILPGFFEKSMDLLAQYPYAGICCSDPVFFDNKTGSATKDNFIISDKPCYFSPEVVKNLMKKTPFWIAGHTSIFKRSAIFEAGCFIPELKWHCDWFAWHVIAFRYGICYIPEPLATMRIATNSYSSSGRHNREAQQKVLNNLLSLLKSPKYKDVLPFFKQSKVLSVFGLQMLMVLLRHPEHRDFFNSKLILIALKELISPIVPSFVKNGYKRLFKRGY